MSASVVEVRGRGFDSQARVAATSLMETPRECVQLHLQMQQAEKPSLSLAGHLAAELAPAQAALVADVVRQANLPLDKVLAVAVHDPGVWQFHEGAPTSYFSLCDGARLAEQSGLNIIDAFPARDLASGGQGGPVRSMAELILLRGVRETRAMVRLGKTTRVTYMPARDSSTDLAKVIAFDVGPGMSLLDALAQRMTSNSQKYDAGGRLAVQGQQIPELLRHWLLDPYFERSLPRWHPRGVRPERFLSDAMRLAVDSHWSVRDLLCTATHFIAETIRRAVERRLPVSPALDQVILAGGGQNNGMLLREIAARLPDTTFVRLAELGIAGDALGSASVAVLASLYIDQCPAGLANPHGGNTGRMLGRLNPGTPQAWQRLLADMAGNEPSVATSHRLHRRVI